MLRFFRFKFICIILLRLISSVSWTGLHLIAFHIHGRWKMQIFCFRVRIKSNEFNSNWWLPISPTLLIGLHQDEDSQTCVSIIYNRSNAQRWYEWLNSSIGTVHMTQRNWFCPAKTMIITENYLTKFGGEKTSCRCRTFYPNHWQDTEQLSTMRRSSHHITTQFVSVSIEKWKQPSNAY